MPKKSKITKKPSLPGYHFGQADETLTKGAATASGLKKEEKKEPSAEMSVFKMKDLSGDSIVTQKDVLIGRGVLNKDGSKANAMKPKGYQMNYKMVNKEGFQMAGSPKKMAAFQLDDPKTTKEKTGKTSKETVKSETIEKKTVPGEEKIVKSKEKSKGSYKSVYDTFKTNDKGQKINPRNKKVYDDLSEFVADAKANPAKEKTTITKTPNKVVETVTKDPVYADKTMFNIDEQRERGRQSLLSSRQSNREGLNKLVAQKAGLKTALKSNIDEVKNQEFGSRKKRRQAIKEARRSKRQGMRSFRVGNFQGAQNVLNKNMIADTRGFDIGASDLARRQAMGIDKSVRYYDTQSALDKGVRAGGTYSDVKRTSQAEADFAAENNPFSSTNSLMNTKFNSGFNEFSGVNMKKGNYMKPMQLSPKAMNYFNKKKK